MLLALSAGGEKLVLGDVGGVIRICDTRSGKVQVEIQITDDGEGGVLAGPVAIASDGSLIAAALRPDRVSVWDAVSGKEIYKLSGERGCLRFSEDDRFLATGGKDGVVRLWELATGELVRTFSGHTAAITSVAFSAGNRRLASASVDGTGTIWDVFGVAGTDPERKNAVLAAADVDQLWERLDEKKAAAYGAMRILGAAPKEAVRVCRDRLQPVPKKG
jgi:WD40 repeat protein